MLALRRIATFGPKRTLPQACFFNSTPQLRQDHNKGDAAGSQASPLAFLSDSRVQFPIAFLAAIPAVQMQWFVLNEEVSHYQLMRK